MSEASANVVLFPGDHNKPPMTLEEYDAERARITATYGGSGREATALRDQALCKLYVDSGQGQEWLAEREGKTQPLGALSAPVRGLHNILL
jgi:hypothetical protein